jgi:hypothetical protein
MSLVHTKELGGPVARSINGKHDDKYFEPNHDMQLSFKKNRNKNVQRLNQKGKR